VLTEKEKAQLDFFCKGMIVQVLLYLWVY